MERELGHVARIIADKGFGFIKTEDGKEYFFHRSSVESGWDYLIEGTKVSFDKGMGQKGPRAEHVVAEK